MPGDRMTIDERTVGESIVVAPVGDVDLSRSPQLQAKLAEVLARRPARIVVDLSKVPYMDSSGVATLVQGLQHCQKAGCELVIGALHPKVRSIFEIAKLTEIFRIVDDIESGD